MVLYVGLLPALSRLCMTRLGMGTLKKDLWLARVSSVVTTAGCLMIALAGSPPMLSVGTPRTRRAHPLGSGKLT